MRGYKLGLKVIFKLVKIFLENILDFLMLRVANTYDLALDSARFIILCFLHITR